MRGELCLGMARDRVPRRQGGEEVRSRRETVERDAVGLPAGLGPRPERAVGRRRVSVSRRVGRCDCGSGEHGSAADGVDEQPDDLDRRLGELVEHDEHVAVRVLGRELPRRTSTDRRRREHAGDG